MRNPIIETVAIEDLPELETEVAISGATRDAEVGGSVCFNVAINVAVVH